MKTCSSLVMIISDGENNMLSSSETEKTVLFLSLALTNHCKSKAPPDYIITSLVHYYLSCRSGTRVINYAE